MRHLAALCFFSIVLVVIFHGVLLHPKNHLLFGFSDGTSQVRDYWAAGVHHKTPFTFKHDSLNGAPEGRHLAPAIQVANLFQPAFVWTFRHTLGLVGAWNVFLFLGLLITAMAGFSFLSWLGCSFGAAIFGAYVIALDPWVIERAFAGHIAFLHGWVYIALLALLIVLGRRRTAVLAVAAGLALAVCFYMAAYDGLFASFLAAVFFGVELFRHPETRRRTLVLGGLTYATAVVLLTPVFFLYTHDKSVVEAQASHPINQLAAYGASPLAYLLPAGRNPVFGFLHGIHPNDFTEQTLFFGYTTILLAALAYVLIAKRDAWLMSDRRRWTAIFCAALVPAAFIMSLPRTYKIGQYHLYMPSAVLSHFTTFWRVYARFGILVGLGLAILASLALTVLQRRGGLWRGSAVAAIALVACLEFLPGHVNAFSTTRQPTWDKWLSAHRGGIVASYPPALDLDPGIVFNGKDFWYQRLDGHPRFAFFGSGTIDTYANAIRLLSRYITDPLTPSILSTEGVRYVVLHDDVYRAQDQAPPTPDPKYFTKVATLPSVRVFTVSAPHVDLVKLVADHASDIAAVEGLVHPGITFGAGFQSPEDYKGTQRRWLVQNGELLVDNEHSRVTTVVLRGLAFSNSVTHELQVVDKHDHVLARQSVPAYEVPLELGPFQIPAGHFTLTLVATPDPASLGGSDSRLGSIYLSPLELAPIPVYPDQP